MIFDLDVRYVLFESALCRKNGKKTDENILDYFEIIGHLGQRASSLLE